MGVNYAFSSIPSEDGGVKQDTQLMLECWSVAVWPVPVAWKNLGRGRRGRGEGLIDTSVFSSTIDNGGNFLFMSSGSNTTPL